MSEYEYNSALDFSKELIEDKILSELIDLTEKIRTFGKELHLDDDGKVSGKQLFVFRKKAYILMTEIHGILEKTTKPTDTTKIILKRQELLLKELESLNYLEQEILTYEGNHSIESLNKINLLFLPPTLLAGLFAMNFDVVNKRLRSWSFGKIGIVFLATSIIMIMLVNYTINREKQRSLVKRHQQMLKIR